MGVQQTRPSTALPNMASPRKSSLKRTESEEDTKLVRAKSASVRFDFQEERKDEDSKLIRVKSALVRSSTENSFEQSGFKKLRTYLIS